MDFENLRQLIVQRITQRVYSSILRYVRNQEPRLWGLEKPSHFLEATVCYTIYLDQHRCGINRLVRKFGDGLGFKLSNKSVDHNSQAIRKVLGGWGQEHIVVGTSPAWNHTAANVERPEPFEVQLTCENNIHDEDCLGC